jgi:hypothetical protein
MIRLDELPAGKLFQYKESVALKSEYRTGSGACKCYLLRSGEMFWGGTATAEELNALMVEPYSNDENAIYVIRSIDLITDFTDLSDKQKLKDIEKLAQDFLATEFARTGDKDVDDQDNLWNEVGETLKESWTLSTVKEKLKSLFTIKRKSPDKTR